jgi:catechol 2,3-dioxygenase-like lactoylglutathione lyase family enzyme
MAIDIQGLCPLLSVYDMPESVHFYCDLLGFEIVNHSPLLPSGSFHWCLLRKGGAELMLNTHYESNDERPPARGAEWRATHGDVTLYLGCPDVDGAYQELRALGVDVKEPQVAPYGMKQMGLTDPDGYGLCFQWRA